MFTYYFKVLNHNIRCTNDCNEASLAIFCDHAVSYHFTKLLAIAVIFLMTCTHHPSFGWFKGFYGVASKYLENYLNWIVFLEKIKKSLTPITDLAKVITANTSAIKNYQSVENKYAELMIPQCSSP